MAQMQKSGETYQKQYINKIKGKPSETPKESINLIDIQAAVDEPVYKHLLEAMQCEFKSTRPEIYREISKEEYKSRGNVNALCNKLVAMFSAHKDMYKLYEKQTYLQPSKYENAESGEKYHRIIYVEAAADDTVCYATDNGILKYSDDESVKQKDKLYTMRTDDIQCKHFAIYKKYDKNHLSLRDIRALVSTIEKW